MLRRGSILLTKPNVVVLGTGWAGCYAAHRLNPSLCNIQVISTRNHMVFTPLLPQTTTGTLEFRSVCEPITNIQPALANLPHRFYRSMIYDVDFDERLVRCVGVGVVGASEKVPAHTYNVHYDYLIMAHGARPNTFNIPGVHETAFFLREVNEAQAIRRRLVQNIMTADLPITPLDETKRLLHVIVVGGGPTGIEFAGNLADFFREDIKKINRSLEKYCKVTILEAGEVLGTFDQALRDYGQKRLRQLNVDIKKTAVVGVTEREVLTKTGEVLPAGLVVWSTGVGPSELTKSLQCDLHRGRIVVDDQLRVLKDGAPIYNVFAAGDCAADKDKPLPTLAAVASRQGTYLATQVNRLMEGKAPTGPFAYKSLGSMVSIGSHSAIASMRAGKERNFDMEGLKALWFWKSAYLTILGSVRSKLYVLVNWTGSKIFGRDITYIGDLKETQIYRALATEEVTREKSRKTAMDMLRSMEPEHTFTSSVVEEAAEKGYIPRKHTSDEKSEEATPTTPEKKSE